MTEGVVRYGMLNDNVTKDVVLNVKIKKYLISQNKLTDQLQKYLYSGDDQFIGLEKYIQFGTRLWNGIISKEVGNISGSADNPINELVKMAE